MEKINGHDTTTRRFPCWIDAYVKYTEDTPSPEIFRLWTAITTVGLALERRVFTYTARSFLYPNLFVFLVGKPGVGKSMAIDPMEELIRQSGVFNMLPQDLTGSAMLDRMADEAYRKRLVDNDQITRQYHSCAMYTSEVGTMIREYDQAFLNILSKIYDCPVVYDQERRYKKDPLVIPHPQLSILAGIQPAYLMATIPNEAWGQGFMSRVIMVHSSEPSLPDLFHAHPLDPKTQSGLVKDLTSMESIHGEYIFSQEAQEAIVTWYRAGCPPVPNSHRLVGYNSRRIIHVQKLAMISRAARGPGMDITLHDFTRALQWLLDVEELMPNVFMEMAGRSDIDVIRDMHTWAWREYALQKKSLHISVFKAYLQTKVHAYQADKIFQSCVNSHIIKREAGTEDMYIPQPVHVHGTVQ